MWILFLLLIHGFFLLMRNAIEAFYNILYIIDQLLLAFLYALNSSRKRHSLRASTLESQWRR